MNEQKDKEPVKRICVGLLAHVDAGKTTLSEALLYTCLLYTSLERLARQAAFEAELEEFALDIMGEYLTGTVGGEIEDAAWSRENEEEETAEDTLGNGDSQEAAILPGGKEAQIS